MRYASHAGYHGRYHMLSTRKSRRLSVVPGWKVPLFITKKASWGKIRKVRLNGAGILHGLIVERKIRAAKYTHPLEGQYSGIFRSI